MPALAIGATLCVRAPHEPLRELPAATGGVEADHEAVLVDLVHRTAGLGGVGAGAGCHRDVAVDRDRFVGRVVGPLLVSFRGALVTPLPQPRLNDGPTALHGLVVGVVA